ncbi:MAG: gliding motility-associated C-terminal domain-containing protein, partial [Vicingaceae bacterium]
NKNTMVGTYCIGADSITVNIADSLAAPTISCTDVTFENGKVIQRFQHSHVEGADLYQLRSVEPSPDDEKGVWGKRDLRDMEGLFHHIVGEQMRAQVRGENNEVPEDAICRYGPVSNIAEACEVIIKPTNVFTPNGDGVNDFLAFDLLELYPGSKLQVFNRWGKLIYEDNDYYNDWDGGDNPAGTYFYILDINDESYGIFKGNFTIIRD